MPGFAAAAMLDTLFQAGAAMVPGAHLDYLRYLCVADLSRAETDLGFVARDSTRECLTRFARELPRIAA